MNDRTRKSELPEHDELLSAVQAFEQILEVIPDEPLALESLFEAYWRLGNEARSLENLDRLIHVIRSDANREAATHLLTKLKALGSSSAGLAQRVSQLEEVGATRKKKEVSAPAATGSRAAVDLQPELNLAWKLFQANELTQEDYANVVQDLTEMSAKKAGMPVTVLHVLSDRAFKRLERILTYMARSMETPLLALSSFELQREECLLLPVDFSRRRAAVVFGALGHDLLVAVLNPLDLELRRDVQALTRRACHFYLVSPADYDRVLHAIDKWEAEEA